MKQYTKRLMYAFTDKEMVLTEITWPDGKKIREIARVPKEQCTESQATFAIKYSMYWEEMTLQGREPIPFKQFRAAEEARRETLLETLKTEYERRLKLDFNSHEDADAWLEEMDSAGWSAKEVVDYIVERYDLRDYDKCPEVAL
jgi:hypothetical protein